MTDYESDECNKCGSPIYYPDIEDGRSPYCPLAVLVPWACSEIGELRDALRDSIDFLVDHREDLLCCGYGSDSDDMNYAVDYIISNGLEAISD